MDWKSQLYFGENQDILREHVPDASVDLICLDPPFNCSARSVAPTFRSARAGLKPGATPVGEERAAQITFRLRAFAAGEP